jgi:tetratricopeptide (TPR) repeat protein
MIKLTQCARNFIAQAQAHYAAGRLPEAEAAYRAALALSPGHAGIALNLGVVLGALGQYQAAIRLFEEAIIAEPSHVAAHYNLAQTFQVLGRTADAILALRRTCALAPQHYEAHRALGFLFLSQGERGRALDHFARTYELRRGEDRDGVAERSLATTTRLKILHDAGQFRYLSLRHRNGKYFEALAKNYEDAARDLSDAVVTLNSGQMELLGESYNTAIHVRDAPEMASGAVAPRPDREAIAEHFTKDGSGIAWFDGLLTPAALTLLRRYLLESTIWHDFSHIGGFVASYLEDGLACPLLLQIADEIRATFPGLFGPHPLVQGWAFKGVEPDAAVDAHADDAAISINFWITPTAANLSPGGGGLTICRVSPPADWVMKEYEGDQERIVTFLEQQAGQCLTIPYRENRAVLFRSRLFHWSDAPQFAAGYENYRINITLLFGRHG